MPETWTQTRILAVGATLFAVGMALLVLAEPRLRVVGGVLAALAWLGATAAWAERRRIDSLPLEVSPRALVEGPGGMRVYRFRCRLGRGRVVLSRRTTVVLHPDEGAPVPLSTLDLGSPTVGPWTITATDPRVHAGTSGRLDLVVEVKEGGRTWQIARSWHTDELEPGRFHPGVKTHRGRLALDLDHWDAVIAPPRQLTEDA